MWLFSSRNEMNRQSTEYSRCSATRRTQVLVIQANGHTGSNQKCRSADGVVIAAPPR